MSINQSKKGTHTYGLVSSSLYGIIKMKMSLGSCPWEVSNEH